jgi:plasmid maintenance system killer protein
MPNVKKQDATLNIRPGYFERTLKQNAKDLASSPGNRLEKLSGDRAGQYSIRINDQWRICFTWKDDGPHDVEIADYH